jgi:hypothetical protein
MYLDGQLPYGPASSNTGGQQTLDAMDALFGNPDLTPNPTGPDPTGGPNNSQSLYTVPGGGDTLVSPSIATTDGIVQFPNNAPTGTPRFHKMATSGECAGMSGLGAMDAATYENHYGKPAPDPNACLSLQCGKTPQQGNEQLNIDCGNFGYAVARSCTDPACAPFLPIPGCAPPAAAPVSQVTKVTPPESNYVPAIAAPLDTPCGGYGSGGVLSALENNALRSTIQGMSGCCRSGYQVVDDSTVAPSGDGSILPLLLAGLALLVLTPSGARR